MTWLTGPLVSSSFLTMGVSSSRLSVARRVSVGVLLLYVSGDLHQFLLVDDNLF